MPHGTLLILFHEVGFSMYFNPLMPNGLSLSYQLDQSISVLRVVGWYFSFYSNFNRTICKQTVETLIRCCFVRRLVWVCTICLRQTKRTLDLYGLWVKDSSIVLCYMTIRPGEEFFLLIFAV